MLSRVQPVDSAESGVPPGRSDVVESVEAARSSCSLGSSPPAVCYLLSMLSSVVLMLLAAAAAAADDDGDGDVWVLQGLHHQKCTRHSKPDFPKLQQTSTKLL